MTQTVPGKSCRSSSGRALSATSTGTRGCATWVSVRATDTATPPLGVGVGIRKTQWSWVADLESERGLSSYSAWAGDRAQEEARDLSKVTQHCGFSSVHGTLLEA